MRTLDDLFKVAREVRGPVWLGVLVRGRLRLGVAKGVLKKG